MWPKTVEKTIELVEQVVFEVEDLRKALEYDSESMAGAAVFIDALEKLVRDLYNDMQAGTYRFENRDLPFMKLIDKQDERMMPF